MGKSHEERAGPTAVTERGRHTDTCAGAGRGGSHTGTVCVTRWCTIMEGSPEGPSECVQGPGWWAAGVWHEALQLGRGGEKAALPAGPLPGAPVDGPCTSRSSLSAEQSRVSDTEQASLRMF